jgi:hypothetical protein
MICGVTPSASNFALGFGGSHRGAWVFNGNSNWSRWSSRRLKDSQVTDMMTWQIMAKAIGYATSFVVVGENRFVVWRG